MTDSSTGVQRLLEERGHDPNRYLPGVTDFGTGVQRLLEERRPAAAESSTGGSAFDVDTAVVGGSALAATLAAASYFLVAGRRRRVLT